VLQPRHQAITFASNDVTVSRGNTLNLYPSPIVQGSWAWFVDNVLVADQTTYQFSWNSTGKQPGHYIINVSVIIEGIGYSGSLRATVTY
jgi:hypothetical protein